MDKLTTKQNNFVLEYIKNGGNAYQAGIKAGYTHNTSRVTVPSLVNHPLVAERIEKAFSKMDRIDIAVKWRVDKLKRLIDEIIPDDITLPVNVARGAIAIAAIAEINKMSGDYAPDKRLSVTVDTTKDKLKDIKRQYKEY